MKIEISSHAKERMKKYDLSEKQVTDCVNSPKIVVEGNYNRKIAQKPLNGYVIRVIYEKSNNSITVVTAYKSKRERYEI